jgi:hypothetical protein
VKNHAQSVADALWDGVRHEPPLASADAGMRSWYLRRVYHPVVGRRRERVWARRSPEPWLTAQWLLERSAGQRTDRGYLRFEGLPGQHSYDQAYRAVSLGRYEPPFLFVAGHCRSGTTSLQNLVRTAFPAHIPPGEWDQPGHPLRLWWYPKHNDQTAARIASIGASSAVSVVAVRPFAEAAASLAAKDGFTSPQELTAEWVDAQVSLWTSMAAVTRLPGAVAVAFDMMRRHSPAVVADALADRLALPRPGMAEATSWEDVYHGGISPEVLSHPQVSHLPHADRQVLTRTLYDGIVAIVGRDLEALDRLYETCLARGVTSAPGRRTT